MTTDLEARVRAGLRSYADATDAIPPPAHEIRKRAVEHPRTPWLTKRRLAWLAVPALALTAGGVAIASGGSRDVADEKFAEANLWNPEWDIPAANRMLVASDTGPDGTEAQYWVGVSAKHAPARCELLLSRRPGQSWRADGSSCLSAQDAPRRTDSSLLMSIGSYPLLAFHLPRSTERLVVTIDDGTQREVEVTAPGFALVVVPARRTAITATAIDAAGTPIETVKIPN